MVEQAEGTTSKLSGPCSFEALAIDWVRMESMNLCLKRVYGIQGPFPIFLRLQALQIPHPPAIAAMHVVRSPCRSQSHHKASAALVTVQSPRNPKHPGGKPWTRAIDLIRQSPTSAGLRRHVSGLWCAND